MSTSRATLADLNSYLAARDLLRQPTHPVLGAYLISLARAQGNVQHAATLAQKFEMPALARLVRTVIEAGDSTTSGWASQLLPAAPQVSSLFMDMVRPLELISRISTSARLVPFNVSIPVQSTGGTFGWLGQAEPTRVGNLNVSSTTLDSLKLGGIITTTQELLRFSPTAATLVQNDVVRSSAKFSDTAFVSNTAAVTNVQPAGILAGVGATGNASGAAAINFRQDMKTLITAIGTDNPSELIVLMSQKDALNLSLNGNDFPNLTVSGGSIGGVPVIASEAVGNRLILLHGPSLLIADAGASVDFSTEASVESDDAPVAGESSPFSQGTSLKSFFQNNLAGFRVIRFLNWKFGRTGAIKWLANTAYGG